MREKIRPIYAELQGMLSEAPEKDHSIYDEDKRLWEKFNELIDSLKNITNEETYESFRLTPIHGNNYSSVSGQIYRSSVSGLISRLYGTYFSNERAPFSGPEPTSIHQTQSNSQNQNVSIEVAVQLGEDLHKALENAETEEEKGFVQEIKSKIGTVKTYIDFVLLVVATAQSHGISLEKIKHLFEGIGTLIK